ncbi:hypothetical protein DSO57_1023918 [Entomophthora muscae]|uniref:Uncharacterized protein n=1 Tax=Entomophthora muscae TaxID=34485 RepID=A0ACC2U1S9_9FUNG|nr:hypothetical protein DSO57_1023918 [Entomophthora muscae]
MMTSDNTFKFVFLLLCPGPSALLHLGKVSCFASAASNSILKSPLFQVGLQTYNWYQNYVGSPSKICGIYLGSSSVDDLVYHPRSLDPLVFIRFLCGRRSFSPPEFSREPSQALPRPGYYRGKLFKSLVSDDLEFPPPSSDLAFFLETLAAKVPPPLDSEPPDHNAKFSPHNPTTRHTHWLLGSLILMILDSYLP